MIVTAGQKPNLVFAAQVKTQLSKEEKCDIVSQSLLVQPQRHLLFPYASVLNLVHTALLKGVMSAQAIKLGFRLPPYANGTISLLVDDDVTIVVGHPKYPSNRTYRLFDRAMEEVSIGVFACAMTKRGAQCNLNIVKKVRYLRAGAACDSGATFFLLLWQPQ